MSESIAAKYKKIIKPIDDAFSWVAAVVFVLMIIMIFVSVLMRKYMNLQFKGVFELTEFAQVLMSFMFIQTHVFKPDSMIVDTLTDMMPKRMKAVNFTFVQLLNVGIMGVLSWQMFVYGGKVQAMHQISKLLQWPVYPFVYFTGVGAALLGLTYLYHLLNELHNIRRG